jgi:hypothetical protein
LCIEMCMYPPWMLYLCVGWCCLCTISSHHFRSACAARFRGSRRYALLRCRAIKCAVCFVMSLASSHLAVHVSFVGLLGMCICTKGPIPYPLIHPLHLLIICAVCLAYPSYDHARRYVCSSWPASCPPCPSYILFFIIENQIFLSVLNA